MPKTLSATDRAATIPATLRKARYSTVASLSQRPFKPAKGKRPGDPAERTSRLRALNNRSPRFSSIPVKEFAQRLFSAKSTRVNITDLLDRERVFRFLRFATVGSSVAVIDFGGVAIASRFLPPLLAVTVAYFIAVCCHFLLNKYWVFRCRRNDYAKQLVQYAGVILTNWVITIAVVHFCLSTFTSDVLIAKLCAIPCATLCNFILMQMVVFRSRHPASKESEESELNYSEPITELE